MSINKKRLRTFSKTIINNSYNILITRERRIDIRYIYIHMYIKRDIERKRETQGDQDEQKTI